MNLDILNTQPPKATQWLHRTKIKTMLIRYFGESDIWNCTKSPIRFAFRVCLFFVCLHLTTFCFCWCCLSVRKYCFTVVYPYRLYNMQTKIFAKQPHIVLDLLNRMLLIKCCCMWMDGDANIGRSLVERGKRKKERKRDEEREMF